MIAAITICVAVAGIAEELGTVKHDHSNKLLNHDNKVDVRNISYKIGNDGNEYVFIEFNRFYMPDIFSIEGENPRIVVDIENVSSFNETWAVIKTEGEFIRQIRSSMDYKARKVRVVLDMEPSRDYFVKPVFGDREKIFSLQISIDE